MTAVRITASILSARFGEVEAVINGSTGIVSGLRQKLTNGITKRRAA
jgi:hypothetical protein